MLMYADARSVHACFSLHVGFEAWYGWHLDGQQMRSASRPRSGSLCLTHARQCLFKPPVIVYAILSGCRLRSKAHEGLSGPTAVYVDFMGILTHSCLNSSHTAQYWTSFSFAILLLCHKCRSALLPPSFFL